MADLEATSVGFKWVFIAFDQQKGQKKLGFSLPLISRKDRKNNGLHSIHTIHSSQQRQLIFPFFIMDPFFPFIHLQGSLFNPMFNFFPLLGWIWTNEMVYSLSFSSEAHLGLQCFFFKGQLFYEGSVSEQALAWVLFQTSAE